MGYIQVSSIRREERNRLFGSDLQRAGEVSERWRGCRAEQL